ncbi:MAG: MGMT family protein [Candidatus Omnitrophota bacterium]
MTPFAKRVYRIVSKIPLGQVRTYGWVARKAGSPGAYRAVGTLLKKNPWPFIIPCHRVIKNNNILGNYAFGKRAKKRLLKVEAEILKCLKSKDLKKCKNNLSTLKLKKML